ncbi:MAG: hypothetical protein ABI035_03205 [Gemmatimonadaceae bacterium]
MRNSNVGRGILWAVVFAFPLAALCALVFRFPMPLAGYEHGVSAVPHALAAVLFYGVMGGFVVLAGLGALSGYVATRISVGDEARSRRLTLVLAAFGSAAAVLLLASLDKIIGPW